MVHIQKYTDVEGVRTRPGMYLGDPARGPQLLIAAVIDLFLDEGIMGRAIKLTVNIKRSELCTITLSGAGMPLYFLADEGRYLPEEMFTSFRWPKGPHSITPHVIVNALSSQFLITIVRDHTRYFQQFEAGVPYPPELSATEEAVWSLSLTLQPDREIFPALTIDGLASLCQKLEDLSYLMPGVEFLIHDACSRSSARFHAPRSFFSWWRTLPMQALFPRLFVLNEAIQEEENGPVTWVRILLQFDLSSNGAITSFVNYGRTPDGGTHVTGLVRGVQRALSDYSRTQTGSPSKGQLFALGEIERHLVALVWIRKEQAMFSDQERRMLVSSEARTIVETLIQKKLPGFLTSHPRETAQLLGRLCEANGYEAQRKKVQAKAPLCLPPKDQKRKRAKPQPKARELAASLETRPEKLATMHRCRDFAVRAALLKNPNTPCKILLELAAHRPRLFLQNPSLPLLLLENPSLIRSFPVSVVRVLLRQPVIADELWVQLKENYRVKDLLLADKRAPLWLLEEISRDQYGNAEAVFAHPLMTESTREDLWATFWTETKLRICQSERTPLHWIERGILREGLSHPDLVKNTALTLACWEFLARQSAPVQEAIVLSKNAPRSVLRYLAEHGSFWVKRKLCSLGSALEDGR